MSYGEEHAYDDGEQQQRNRGGNRNKNKGKQGGQFALDPDYIDVAARIREFRKAHPNGSLQPVDPAKPYSIERLPVEIVDKDGEPTGEYADQVFIVYVASAYRTPDDPCPGIGSAWEPFPGRTPYTRNSELQNAETSAWGRAIVASLTSDTKAVASADEIRNRRAEQEGSQEPGTEILQATWDKVVAARGDLSAEQREEMRMWAVQEGIQLPPLLEAQGLAWLAQAESIASRTRDVEVPPTPQPETVPVPEERVPLTQVVAEMASRRDGASAPLGPVNDAMAERLAAVAAQDAAAGPEWVPGDTADRESFEASQDDGEAPVVDPHDTGDDAEATTGPVVPPKSEWSTMHCFTCRKDIRGYAGMPCPDPECNGTLEPPF